MGSEKKNKRKDRLESYEHLAQLAIQNSMDGVIYCDDNGRIFYANDSAISQLEYSSDELMQLSIQDIDCNYHADQWPVLLKKVKAKGQFKLESCHRTKNGSMFPVEMRVHYFHDDHISFFTIFLRNISESKENERILLKSESLLRKTLDVTSDGAWDRNLATGDVYYGERWATALGYTEEDLQSGKISWDSLLHPDDREKAVSALRDHFSGKTPQYEAEFRLRNSENGYQWIHARGQIIEFDKDGKALRFVGTHTDITKRKNLENSLVRISEETKMFAYSVVHDLKNPVIAIRSLAQRFMYKFSELSDSKKLSYTEKMIVSTNQIVALVEKINSYISSRETRPNFEMVPLKEVMHSSRDEFSAQLQSRSIRWKECAANPTIKMDRIAIIRVLRNLIENALKYGGPQLSEISIRYQNTAGYHVLAVRDNGIGMNVEDSERIFQPFERKGGGSDQDGSGLGLAIVQEIALQHKGEVWVVPNKKRGVQFCIAISKYL